MAIKQPVWSLDAHCYPRSLLKVLCGAIMLAVFMVDTLTTVDIAIAVLYVVVILLASIITSSGRFVSVTAIACLGLTLSGFFISHGLAFEQSAFGRCIVSLAAIAITGMLAWQIQSVTASLVTHIHLLSKTHDAIILCDLEGTVQAWSDGATRLYGWTEAEAVGRNLQALLIPQSDYDLGVPRKLALARGTWEGELLETCKDGRLVTVASRWSVWEVGGKPVSIIAANNDVTAEKEAQRSLAEAMAQMAHVSRVTALDELVASIAHEVNQPLTAIGANGGAGLRWLKRSPPELDEVEQAISCMVKDAARASEIIHNVRALARGDDSVRTPIRLDELITATLAFLQREITKAQVQVSITGAENPPLVLGRYVQVQQVLLNLVMNALAAMATQPASRRELRITLTLDHRHTVVVAVHDTGPGIEAHALPLVFNAFYTTKVEGMGMGLAICRSIIDAHGGQLWVKSQEGAGASFYFSLPLCDPKPAALE